jgi:DNA (cytosine-5)-methyltransferase 1
MIQAGFRVLAGADNDAEATITYLHNLGTLPCDIHFLAEEDSEKLETALQRLMSDDIDYLRSGGNRPISMTGVPVFFFGDIRELSWRDMLDAIGMDVGEVDCVVGGPPCQGYSMAGKRHVMDPRNSLVFDFARLVCEIRPKTMVMENVPGLLSMVTPDGFPVIDAICRYLEDGGYGAYEPLRRSLLQSSGCGAVIRSSSRNSKRASQSRQAELFDKDNVV